MNKQQLKQEACLKIEQLAPLLYQLADFLAQNPEISGEERKAVNYLQKILKQFNFDFTPILKDSFSTAFIAAKGDTGKKIAFLAEYDALPNIGHGCGHNLISMMSVGAAIAFSQITGKTAQTVLFGCPAEETVGAKINIAENGFFDDINAALIIHPDDKTSIGGTSYASHPLEVSFIGKEAHIADPVYHGINALDALVDFYTELKQLQKTFTKPNLIGTIITEGGTAPNIIPAKATLRSTVRALDSDYLENVMLARIKHLAEKIAEKHNAKVQMHHYEPLYKNLRSDERLNEYYKRNFTLLGEKYTVFPDDYADGSTDVGNVSHATRTCQPTICIGHDIFAHTAEFACAAASDFGKRQALKGAKAMVMTAIDILFENEVQNENR